MPMLPYSAAAMQEQRWLRYSIGAEVFTLSKVNKVIAAE